MNETPEQIVASVIQRVYGDATQTVLDQRAAAEIISALREAGWASLAEVGGVILAAGGRVEVTPRIMDHMFLGDVEVMRHESPGMMGTVFSARVKVKL